jgi:hypothetical protein
MSLGSATPSNLQGTALVEDMLTLARALVRQGWCQGAAARDECDRPVAPESTFACRWSAAGALERVWARHEDRFGLGLAAFERANLALVSLMGEAPQSWNDDDGRTVTEVLDALAEAARLVGRVPPDSPRQPYARQP